MSTLIPFDFDGHQLSVVTDENGEVWFLASQLCEILGFSNPRQALMSHVDEDDVQKLDTLTAGGKQAVNHVNESGLYALTFGSTKPDAKRFKRWVTSTVLPAIRRTGSYSAGPVRLAPVADDFRALHDIAQVAGLTGSAAVIAASNATARRTGENPLALIGMTSIASTIQERLLTATDIAKETGLPSAQRANALLEQVGLHTSERSGRGKKAWQPTASGQPFGRWEDTGKRHNDGTPVHQWKWTESVLNEILRRQPLAA